jgi:hypothetical protein
VKETRWEIRRPKSLKMGIATLTGFGMRYYYWTATGMRWDFDSRSWSLTG